MPRNPSRSKGNPEPGFSLYVSERVAVCIIGVAALILTLVLAGPEFAATLLSFLRGAR